MQISSTTFGEDTRS